MKIYKLFPTSAPPGMNEHPIFTKDKPSEEFISRVISEGTPAVDCQLCGRTHFNFTGEFMEEGELEQCLTNKKNNPLKYIPRDGQVYFGHIDGLQVVHDCPCNGMRIIEDFLWNNRRIIADYFVERSDKELHDAQANVKLAQSIAQVS